MDKFKKINREWVKTAAIIFLAVLLVLTFFSNTILNISLPEVSASAVTDGTITNKVKGTGTVSAIGNTEVKAKNSTTITTVRAKEGAEVVAGDVLFIMGEAEELEEAQDELDAARYALMRYQSSYPVNLSSASLDVAYEKWQTLAKEADEAEVEYKQIAQKHAADPDYVAATKMIEEDNYAITTENTKYAQDLELAQQKVASCTTVYNDHYSDWSSKVSSGADEQTIKEAKSALDVAQTELFNANVELETLESNHNSTISNLEADIAKQNAIISSIDSELATYLSKWETLNEQASEAYDEYCDAYDAASTEAISDSQSAAQTSVDVAEYENKVKKLEAKVAKLSGGDENAVTAPVGGTISSVSVSPGDTVAKNDILCVIENPDQGYQMSFSVTNDQAKRIKVGSTATVSNYYWGSEITATVTSIKVDKKNPQTNKTVTCSLEGDVTNGSQITVAIGEKSASYDILVPNSAVRNDANGSFVLKVDDSRSNALGNRYFAKRVAVEVLASDDDYTAVSGDLSNGDFVITVSSEPIKSGDQIRLSDSSNG